MNKKYIRPSWDEYFMKLARLVATRSTCLRRRVGAVYNGAPSGMAHCLDIGCIRDQLKIPSGTRAEICRGIHAEQNAIIQCAVYGIPTEGSTIYVTHQPCTVCTKILIGAGIKRIVYLEPYPDKFAQSLLKGRRVSFIPQLLTGCEKKPKKEG